MHHSNKSSKNFKLISFSYLGYMVILFYVAIQYFPVTFKTSYNGLLFPSELNLFRVITSIVICLIMVLRVIPYYCKPEKVSEMTVLLLLILYFIPGLVIYSVTTISNTYYFAYIAFMAMLLISDRIIRRPKVGIHFKGINNNIVLKILIAISLLTTVYLSFIFKQTFSFSKLLIVISDVYETRSSAMQVHWLIITLQQWAVYFCAFMITYSLLNKKYLLTVVFIFCELFFFILQGNRIGLFVTILAIVFGCFKNINPQIISIGTLSIVVLILIECIIWENGGIITNIFRRFSIVPNRIAYHYFDFFCSNTPDLLRSAFPRISETILGLPSPYPNIAHTIGETYFYTEMGANTGMMGSAMFTFGISGLVLEPICIVLFTRILDKCTMHITNKSLLFSISAVFCSLLINAPNALANCLSLSYYLLLILSLLFVSLEKDNVNLMKAKATATHSL